MINGHQDRVGLIWRIAERLRGPYKQREYVDVILPLVVIRRLDLAMAKEREEVWDTYDQYQGQLSNMDDLLAGVANSLIYNVSKYDWKRLLDAPNDLSQNLIAYLNGFSPDVQDIIEKFDFRSQVQRLYASNLLLPVMQEFAKVDLHPDSVDNHAMGDIFEELIRRFNEQYNETPGEHFTPREVIRLMVHLLLGTENLVLHQSNLIRTIYDPACGTGGMLTEAKNYILEHNNKATILLYGQEINPNSYAVAKADMLLKGENPKQLVFGDTFSEDGHTSLKFNFMLSNPPFGVDWRRIEWVIKRENETLGWKGRFGAGFPRTSDGSLLFLQHMLSKMKPDEESRIVIVFNGSPLFTGDAGSGESEIRRWIIENDWLEGIIGLPDQLFYNTGINTYLWVLTNHKSKRREGRVQLVNAISFYERMWKNKGDKRNEISQSQITEISTIYNAFEEGEYSKIFDNIDFGYRKVRIERPLRLNFQVTPERLEKLEQEPVIRSLTEPAKDGRKAKTDEELAQGKRLKSAIFEMLQDVPKRLHQSRPDFKRSLNQAMIKHQLLLSSQFYKTILSALSERDEEAEICYKDDKGKEMEPDGELRDHENLPLKEDIWAGESQYDEKIPLKVKVEAYIDREVKPYVQDAYIDEKYVDERDGKIGRIGYEINFARYFYRYQPLRPLEVIDHEIKSLEKQILAILNEE